MFKLNLFHGLALFMVASVSIADAGVVHRTLAPDNVAPALGQYSLGVESSAGSRWVHVAGQTGIRKDGSIPKDFATQAHIAVDNVKAILGDAGMSWEDVVSYTIFMTHREDLEEWKTLGKELLAGAKPAGTLVFVSGLVHPDWRIEIEARAAKK